MRHLISFFLFVIPAFLGVGLTSCGLFDQKPVCPPTKPNCVNLPEIPTQNGYEGVHRKEDAAPPPPKASAS